MCICLNIVFIFTDYEKNKNHIFFNISNFGGFCGFLKSIFIEPCYLFICLWNDLNLYLYGNFDILLCIAIIYLYRADSGNLLNKVSTINVFETKISEFKCILQKDIFLDLYCVFDVYNQPFFMVADLISYLNLKDPKKNHFVTELVFKLYCW